MSLVCRDATQSTADSAVFEFNMSALTTLLRRQAEQNPSASYFNVDILKYHIKNKEGAGSCPFQLVAYWKCESTHTDLKVRLLLAFPTICWKLSSSSYLPTNNNLTRTNT